MIAAVPHLLAAVVFAAALPDKGYVVRADSGTVWLDLTAADGAAPGRAFEIYVEGEELAHPMTGVSLGRVQDVLASGALVAVSGQFSTGRTHARKGEIKPGQRARWAAAPSSARPATAGGDERAPKTRGATLDFAVTAMAVGDFDGVGRPQLVLASEKDVRLYAYPALDGKVLAETLLSGTGARILGLEAADLDGDERPELFVSVYDDAFKRFETRVLKLVAGKWLKAGELPFLTRAYQDAKGARVLATQQVTEDAFAPLGAIYPLVRQDGKYAQGRPAVRFPRADWLYAFTTAQLTAGEPALLYYTPVHALRVQLGKEWWRTPEEDYGQTPLRVRWQERLLEFPPPLVAGYGASGFEGLYAVRNKADLGGLAGSFGLFNRGELARKRWNGLALETDWHAELPGCAQGLAVVETKPGQREIAVAVRGATEQSSVWTFDP